jgi:hypothetical protein
LDPNFDYYLEKRAARYEKALREIVEWSENAERTADLHKDHFLHAYTSRILGYVAKMAREALEEK